MTMTLTIPRRLAKRLERISAQAGKSPHSLISSALKNQLDYEEWFLKAVDEGVAAADRGDVIQTAELLSLIKKQRRARARRSRKAD